MKTYLVQLLLPLYDKEGRPFSKELFESVRSELVEKFGGVTAFTQSPAEGLWKPDDRTIRDHVLFYEVMTEVLAESWWSTYRTLLEDRFKQDLIVIRSQQVQLL
jgi:hypothetical protein